MALGFFSSSATKSRSSSVGIFVRLSRCLTVSTAMDLLPLLLRGMNFSRRGGGRRRQKGTNRIHGVPGIGNLDQVPAPEPTMIVDGFDPQFTRSRNLRPLILPSLAADFDDQVQGILTAVPIVKTDNKIGHVVVLFAVE